MQVKWRMLAVILALFQNISCILVDWLVQSKQNWMNLMTITSMTLEIGMWILDVMFIQLNCQWKPCVLWLVIQMKKEVFFPQDHIKPSMTLQQTIFPFIEKEIESVDAATNSTAYAFLNLLSCLHVVILQHAATMILNGWVHFSSHWMCLTGCEEL